MKPKVSVITGDWMTVDEAAQALSKSTRSVERLIAAGVLDSRIETTSGRRVRMIHRKSVDSLKAAEAAPAALVPAAKRQPTDVAVGGLQALALSELLYRDLAHRGSASEKLWLSIEEAASLTGFAQSFLLGLIHEEKVTALKSGPHGAWRIRRASLEQFEG